MADFTPGSVFDRYPANEPTISDSRALLGVTPSDSGENPLSAFSTSSENDDVCAPSGGGGAFATASFRASSSEIWSTRTIANPATDEIASSDSSSSKSS